MVPTDDYTIVDPEGGEEIERAPKEEKGQSKDESSSSSESSPTKRPGIISSTSQFQTQPPAKLIKPGQSISPSNNIRHITLDAFRVLNNSSYRYYRRRY